jgi:hypothetical protein
VEALLLPELGSPVTDDAMEAVCVMVVPDAVPAFTVTTKLKFAVEVAAKLEFVQVSEASVQVQPEEEVVKETAVVLAGSVSVKVTVLAAAGPALVAVCV